MRCASIDLQHSGLLIGKAYHQERILLIDEGEREGEVVFDDGDGLVVLASSLAGFFLDLVEYGLSIEAVISAKS